MAEVKAAPSYQESYPMAMPQQSYPPHNGQVSPPMQNPHMQMQQQHPSQTSQHGMMPQQGQQGMMPQQGQQPMMQQQQSQYQMATPLHAVSMGPTPVDCPSCGKRSMTRITYESGNTTFAWALGLCVCVCLGCIPFLMNSLKDVVHHCGNCGCRLATWHRSGAVEVHAHA